MSSKKVFLREERKSNLSIQLTRIVVHEKKDAKVPFFGVVTSGGASPSPTVLTVISGGASPSPTVLSVISGYISLPCVKGGGTACRDGGIVKTKDYRKFVCFIGGFGRSKPLPYL